MQPPSRPSKPKIYFHHPDFGPLYSRVLADVADRRLDEWRRMAAARALAFLLGEQPTERVVADVLTAIRGSLDVPRAVRTLLRGLRDAPKCRGRVPEWTRAVVDRALDGGHLPSFVVAARLLVELPGYDGTVPARWRLAILRAADAPELTTRVFLFARAYARRFPAESWLWVREARRRSMVTALRQRVTVEQMREAREL